jgi:hypothetical protein
VIAARTSPHLRSALVRGLVACALIASAGSVVGCAARHADNRGLAPVAAQKTQRSTQVDAQNAQSVVLAYIDALRSGDATEAGDRMTRYRRPETREPGWRRANSWWKAVRIKTIARPGHYLVDERTFVRLYESRFGHEPYKLLVLNVAYSAVASAPAGDVDFVVTKDSARAPWLVHDYGGAVFPH